MGKYISKAYNATSMKNNLRIEPKVSKKTLKKAGIFAKKLLGKEGTGHDWWHIERVLNNARLINKTEKADWSLIQLAILLHDVGDWKVIGRPEDDYTIAENFMLREKVPLQTIEHIMFIIQNMSFTKSLGKKNNAASLEFKIVQDADRLDAIGAIGIARTFAFGGKKGRPIYDPTQKARIYTSTNQARRAGSTTIHHFEEKLFRIKDSMNTSSAKRIAKERHDFMKTYIKRFLEEWEGKK